MNNMFQEIQEEPAALRECIEQNQVMVKFLAEEIRSKNPSYLVLAARGTSCNAAKFAKYVFETYVGLPVMIAAPSVLTKYGGKLKLSNAVVVGISQSGAAQDVCSLIDRGNRDGSLTVAITNTEGSLLSQRAKFHLNCCAGLEKSLAATKTFLCQLALLTQLAAQLSGEPRLLDLVKRLPRIAAAMLDRTPVPLYERVLYFGPGAELSYRAGIWNQDSGNFLCPFQGIFRGEFYPWPHCHAAGFYSGVCAGNRLCYG